MSARRLASLALALAAAFTIVACDDGNSSQTGTGMGMVNVRMVASPLDILTVESVNVTFTGVTIYPEEAFNPMGMVMETGAISLMDHPATFDLLTLTTGEGAHLGSGEVPTGNYGRIRLELSAATLVYKNGTSQPLIIESSKVDIPIRFRVTVSADIHLTLDFDAAASVQVNDTGIGTFTLRPVVTPV